MFVRAKKGGNEANPHRYIQIVESYRQGKTVRQRVLATLGRLDQLQQSGELDGLIQSLSRYSETVRVISAARSFDIKQCIAKPWGPALVLGRLWERQSSLPEIVGLLFSGRRYRFDLERVCFALALQRLCEPGPDLQGSEWGRTVEAPGFSSIELQHMYRAVAWLAEMRGDLERELFLRDRDLFNQELDLVFLDTTSTYIYRDEETEYAKRGHSRDRRPDLPQMVLCIAVDRRGWPISWEIFPGNTAHVKAFEKMVEKLREKFRIGRVSVVADRGMISRDTVELLTSHGSSPFDYILGCRMRKDKEVREEVLSRAGRYQEVAPNLKVKDVRVEDRRYVVCRNDEEVRKDAAAREAIVSKLQERLDAGQIKSLIGNVGYRRFLSGSRGSWLINEKAVKEDSAFDGVFALRTNLDLSVAEIATTYKGLWRIGRTFREEKSTLEVRPLYHHQDETRIGHIVAAFLALRLEVDLQRRMEEKGIKTAWPSSIRDLCRLQAVHLTLDGVNCRIRTDVEGSTNEAFRAAGVRIPPRVTRIREAKPCSAIN
jgi:hypothetical protein